MRKYLPKFPLTSDESLKGYEVVKIVNGIENETEKSLLAKVAPVCIGIALVVVFVMTQCGG